MKLRYHSKEVELAITDNNLCMKFRAYNIHFAILIKGHHRFSTVRVRQKLDCIMVDSDNVIKSFEIAMHENTVFEDENAVNTIIVPTGTFSDLRVNSKFEIIE